MSQVGTSTNKVQTEIYVISLEGSHERKAIFEAHARASSTDLQWSYYKARTELTPDLSYRSRDAVIAKGRTLYPAELGVYASHYAVWQRFLAGDANQVIVLEDDVVVDWDFIATLGSCDLSGLGLRYLKLFNKNITPFRVVSEHFCRRTLIDCRGFAHGMQAYMLTRAGAKFFSYWCRTVRRPIDDELDRSWAHGVPNVAVFPFAAFERHVPSTIGTVRYELHAVPLEHYGQRVSLRLQEYIRRAYQRLFRFGYQSRIKILF